MAWSAGEDPAPATTHELDSDQRGTMVPEKADLASRTHR